MAKISMQSRQSLEPFQFVWKYFSCSSPPFQLGRQGCHVSPCVQVTSKSLGVEKNQIQQRFFKFT